MKIGIVGLGLIGGSLAKAYKKTQSIGFWATIKIHPPWDSLKFMVLSMNRFVTTI